MKKLNNKGFTLVELLAVIVILAIVVGITLVTVLPTLESAKVEAFETAVATVKNYLQEQRDMAWLSEEFQESGSYIKAIGTAECTSSKPCDATCQSTDESIENSACSIIEDTGYTGNITELKWYVTGNKVQIACATAAGDYVQGTGESNTDPCE